MIKAKRYKQKLRDAWLHMPEFRPWLRRDPEDSYRALCRFCKCSVNTKISLLRSHAQTKKHFKRSNAGSADNRSAVDIKPNEPQSLDEEEPTIDNDIEYRPYTKTTKRVNNKTTPKRNGARKQIAPKSETENVTDYEELIESLALYEPEQALFPSEITYESEQTDQDINSININEEMITNAVTAAVNNLKDSSQIFADYVADRLRALSDKAAENTKDKIMQVIMQAAAADRIKTDVN